MNKVPSHIHRNRHGTLYFRLAVPRDLRQHLGRTEIHRSLRTTNRKKALPLALALWVKFSGLFEQLRKSPLSGETYKTHFIGLGGIEIDHQGNVEEERQTLKLLLESLSPEERQALLRPEGRAKAAEPAASRQSLSELTEAYIEAQDAKKGLKPGTQADYRATFALFIAIMGDREIGQYSRGDGREFFAALRRYPANAAKKVAYRGLTPKQLLEKEIPARDLLSSRTTQKHLERMSTFYSWCLAEGHCSGLNPFAGLMSAARVRRESASHQAFTDNELRKIFSAEHYPMRGKRSRGRGQPNASKYWLPLVGLYTGARIAEIAQLKPDHVVNEKGVWLFDIKRTEHEGDYVFDPKTSAGERQIPIHSTLLELGFLDFVRDVRSAGDPRLFMGWRFSKRGGFGDAASKWFARHCDKCGVTAKGKVFHSFRSTLVNALRNFEPVSERPQERDIKVIIGHEVGDTLSRHYSADDLKPSVKLEIIRKFQPSVDLEPIRVEW